MSDADDAPIKAFKILCQFKEETYKRLIDLNKMLNKLNKITSIDNKLKLKILKLISEAENDLAVMNNVEKEFLNRN